MQRWLTFQQYLAFRGATKAVIAHQSLPTRLWPSPTGICINLPRNSSANYRKSSRAKLSINCFPFLNCFVFEATKTITANIKCNNNTRRSNIVPNFSRGVKQLLRKHWKCEETSRIDGNRSEWLRSYRERVLSVAFAARQSEVSNSGLNSIRSYRNTRGLTALRLISCSETATTMSQRRKDEKGNTFAPG